MTDTPDIRDRLIEHGILDPKASELADIPGISVQLIDDAFTRSENDTAPIIVASRIKDQAEARGRRLERLKRVKAEETRLNESRRHECERYNIETAKQVSEEIEIVAQIPDDELDLLIEEVIKANPYITSLSVTENRMLRGLVIEQHGLTRKD